MQLTEEEAYALIPEVEPGESLGSYLGRVAAWLRSYKADAQEFITAAYAVTGVPYEPRPPRRRREYEDDPNPAPHEPWRYPDCD